MKLTKRKVFPAIIGSLFISLAIFTFANYLLPIYLMKIVFVVMFAVAGFVNLVSLFVNNYDFKHNLSTYISPFVFIGLSIFLNYAPEWFWGIIPALFGVWGLLNAALCFITAFLYKNDGVGEWVWQLVFAILYLVVGLWLIITPLAGFGAVGIFIGIYFLFLGLTLFRDVFFPVSGRRLHSGKRRIRIIPPVFLVAFIPQRVMDTINEKLSGNDKLTNDNLDEAVKQGKRITKSNPLAPEGDIHLDNMELIDGEDMLEVFVHLSEDTAFGFGHCDICFNNTVVSYGCYDISSNKMFGAISDGVLVFTPRKEYIRYCLEKEGKILVGFELDINKVQSANVQKQLDKMQESTYRWYCDLEVEKRAGADISYRKFKDPASALFEKTGARFYKFTTGKFKTYFVAGSNCVKVADCIVGAAGIDEVSSGIITPGSYYSFLDTSFRRQDGTVKSEHIYLDPMNKLEKKKRKS